MFKLYCRLFQKTLHHAQYLLYWRQPQRFYGVHALAYLPDIFMQDDIKKVFIITDKNIMDLHLLDDALQALRAHAIAFTIYDETVPNPTDANVEAATSLYNAHDCEAIIAFGGGSVIDCAKGVGARIARPHKPVHKMKGLFRILKRIPLLIAIPTTAGTGSEATLAAIISDSKTHQKQLILDLSLIPRVTILDPLLTLKLPPAITAATGMDALTHAVESYIGQSTTKKTRKCSEQATQLIFTNLLDAYHHGQDVSARTNMLEASYLAGVAFTRSYVGYAHAIAHAVGGLYDIPHGLANAVILPHVLKRYGTSVEPQLAALADAAGIGAQHDTTPHKAAAFIAAIEDLNHQLGHPTVLTEIKAADIPTITKLAYKEAHPLYPVPKILTKSEMHALVQTIAG